MLARCARPAAIVTLAASAGCAGQCGARGGHPPELPPLVRGADGRDCRLLDRGAYKAYYDRSGRLARLEYDSNGDGRADHIAHHDGAKMPHLLEVDEDFDGRTDRWDDYDAAGNVVKVGRSRRGRGPDVWTFPGRGGEPVRRELDEDGDARVDRAETLTAGRTTAVELDTDRDGRFDRWQEWADGRLASERLDTDGDGRPDHRLRYGPGGNVVAAEALAAQ